MSKLGDYIKQQKEKDIERFFGKVNHKSNKYFTFNRIINDDEIIIITSNIKIINTYNLGWSDREGKIIWIFMIML